MDNCPAPGWVVTLQGVAGTSEKDWRITLGLSIFAGLFGADRLYLGSLGLAALKCLTLGGLGIWWAADLAILLVGRMRDADGRFVKMS